MIIDFNHLQTDFESFAGRERSQECLLEIQVFG